MYATDRVLFIGAVTVSYTYYFGRNSYLLLRLSNNKMIISSKKFHINWKSVILLKEHPLVGFKSVLATNVSIKARGHPLMMSQGVRGGLCNSSYWDGGV